MATSTAGGPEARINHSALWTGREMIVWGGDNAIDSTERVTLPNGGLYCAVVDAPPVANAQSLVVAENGSLPITLTAADPDGDALTYAIVGSPAHGALSGTPPAVTYLPAAGYFGSDSFTFKANDGLSDSNVATVAIVVKPAGYLFYTVPQCRLFDSRNSPGALLAGVEKVIQAAGHCGVPATARALAVNVTVVVPTKGGYLNLYAAAGNSPPTSIQNFAAGQIRANNAVLQLSQGASFVALFTMTAGGKADLLVDISGYFE